MATVTINKQAKTVTVVLPLESRVSKSAKNVLIATTSGGMKTDASFDGKPVSINVNVYVPNDSDGE